MNQYRKNALLWWDKKRLLFNAIILFTALAYLLAIAPEHFGLEQIFGALVYAGVLNIFYCLGFIVEIYDEVYFQSRLNSIRYRWLFFVLGTLISLCFTLIQINLYYYNTIG